MIVRKRIPNKVSISAIHAQFFSLFDEKAAQK